MPTFLTEFLDPEDQGPCIGPYVVARDLEEAERIAKHLVMEPDGCPVRVVGELGESIPFDMDAAALTMLRQQVKGEVDAIVRGTRNEVLEDETAHWKAVWDDEP